MRTFKAKPWVTSLAILAGIIALIHIDFNQRAYAQQNQLGTDRNAELRILPVQGNVDVIEGDGGNVTVQYGDQGLIVVDSGFAPMADKLLSAIKRVSTKPIRFVIDTHIHADHIGGNEVLARSGASLIGGNDFAGGRAQPASIISFLTVLTRLSVSALGQGGVPQGSWPEDTYDGESKELFLNNDSIQIIHLPAAHTDGDSIVYFRRADVISTGDIFVTTSFPRIDTERGGTFQGIIDGLNRILKIAIPGKYEEDGTLIIPGHGRLCDESEVVEYRDMLTIVRDRMKDMIAKGMKIEQIKSKQPAIDFDKRYSVPGYSTDMFLDAAYKSLTQQK